MIELIQIKKLSSSFELNTIFVNPKHILYLSEDREYKGYLREGKINLGLNLQTVFTRLRVFEGNRTQEITIVGDPRSIQTKMTNVKRLLRD
tara:strand:+ start:1429 stop:1701 length:273 start_codon:yes stop_codon:yes gene_type:complete